MIEWQPISTAPKHLSEQSLEEMLKRIIKRKAEHPMTLRPTHCNPIGLS